MGLIGKTWLSFPRLSNGLYDEGLPATFLGYPILDLGIHYHKVLCLPKGMVLINVLLGYPILGSGIHHHQVRYLYEGVWYEPKNDQYSAILGKAWIVSLFWHLDPLRTRALSKGLSRTHRCHMELHDHHIMGPPKYPSSRPILNSRSWGARDMRFVQSGVWNGFRATIKGHGGRALRRPVPSHSFMTSTNMCGDSVRECSLGVGHVEFIDYAEERRLNTTVASYAQGYAGL